jgi:hypothetical protein
MSKILCCHLNASDGLKAILKQKEGRERIREVGREEKVQHLKVFFPRRQQTAVPLPSSI